MKPVRQITAVLIMLGSMLPVFVLCPAAWGQSVDANGIPSLAEVYWQSSRTINMPGLSNLIVLDPEIAKVEAAGEGLQIFGLSRGETVVVGYLHDKPVSIRVRVVARPIVMVSPSLLRRQSEMAQGSFGSSVQFSNSGGPSTMSVVNSFSWTQLAGSQGRLYINSEVEDNDYQGGHSFNIRHGTAAYRSPGLDVTLLDNVVSLSNNGSQHYVSPYMSNDSIELRGAAVTLKQGDNQYMFFGGTSIPFYFLTLGATRDIAGFSFHRKQSANLDLFATTSYINSPVDFLDTFGGRRNDWMQTAGFSYQPSEHWTLQGTGGISGHGSMGRGELNYVSRHLTFFAGGTASSLLFPLNRVQSAFSGTTSGRAGITLNSGERFTESLYYQHTITQPFNNLVRAGSSDYLTPAFFWRINPRDDLNFNYTYSHNQGGFSSQPSTGNRFDTTWRHQITSRVTNSAQFTVGSLQDPLQTTSEDEFSFRDSLSFPIKAGNMMLGFEQDRRNPSLVRKLGSELNLLSPALQALYLQDPVLFVQSNNLPPEVRALLDAEIPVSTSVSASAQLRMGKKLLVSPNFSFARTTSGTSQSWTPFAGYGVSYQVRPSLDFNSGLAKIWALGNGNSVQRTTLLYFGFTKRFSAMPQSLLPSRHVSRIVEGRVFRDNNVNGAFNAGEQGLVGLQVKLDDGEIAETDEQGRYKFNDVSQGEHTVSISLTQFAGPVRMTTKNLATVDLIRQRVGVVNFGIVDFARVTGSVFNDLRFEGKKPPDAKGLPNVHLLLDDGKLRRTIVAQDTGDFEIDDVAPGDYRISVDTNTLPPNYSLPVDTFTLHVSPVSTAVQEIPARAQRSIAGRVFVKVLSEPAATADTGNLTGNLKISGVPTGSGRSQRGGQGGGKPTQAGRGQAQGSSGQAAGGDFNLVPLAGVSITAGASVATTDENGNFLLRDLPAGDLIVTMVPVKELQPGMKVPEGKVRMPGDPIQVQGATIVISNPDLAPYLVDKPKF